MRRQVSPGQWLEEGPASATDGPATVSGTIVRGDRPETRPFYYPRIPTPKARGSHCPNGHEYTEANTSHNADGYRRCLTCKHAGDCRRYDRRRLS